MTWQTTGKINPTELTHSRVQLHSAIQFIAATGAALAEPLPDYSHTSLMWKPSLEVFVGSRIRSRSVSERESTQSFQVALDPVSLTLILLDKQSETIASLPLHGKTMAAGLDWLKQEISQLGADASNVIWLDYPPDDFPDSPLALGAAFDASQKLASIELANYYANTHQLLQNIVATSEDASAVRIWPHHFDMATLIMLPGLKNETPLTIGVGLSPGDTSYHEPYWYVSPYPYPDTANLPPLAGDGFWHTQHWVGAVLTASRLTQDVSTKAQQQQVESFIDSAITASINLLKSASAEARR